jgi:hypothetical protein
LAKVIDHARNTNYVQQVISYVKMLGEPVENVEDHAVTQSADF